MNTLLQYKKHLCLFLLIGILTYFPILTNGFIWDDFEYILKNFLIYPHLIQNFTGESLFNSSPFYRPLTSLVLYILHAIFGQQSFFYHLTQLLLHILGTFLLFLFLRLSFSVRIAFFLALLFLVHPINVESVAWISAISSPLPFVFGMAALLLGINRNLTTARLTSISLLIFLALLAKELGVLFLLLILLYRFLFKLGRLQALILSGAGISIFYLVFRFLVVGVALESSSHNIPVKMLSFAERLINIPAIIFYYLKTFIFPMNLSVWQFWVVKYPNFQEFYLPLLWVCTFILLLLLTAWFLYKRKSISKHEKEKDHAFQKLIFFSGWFIVGILPALQLFPIDMTVADRWFYFPIVGLLGLTGLGLQLLRMPHWINTRLLMIPVIVIVGLLSVRSFVRSLDWQSNLSLFSHDVNLRPEQFKMKDVLAMELFKIGRGEEALQYSISSVSIFPTITNTKHLGTQYLSKGQNDQAIAAFTDSINIYKSLPDDNLAGSSIDDMRVEDSYRYLAIAYTSINQPQKAKEVLSEGLKVQPTSDALYLYLALVEVDLDNREEALKAIAKSNELSPSKIKQFIYNHLKSNKPLDSLRTALAEIQ